MFCIHCGKEIVDGAVFCSFCGKKQAIPQEPVENFKPITKDEQPKLPSQVVDNDSSGQKEKKKNKKGIIAVAIAMVAVLVVLALCLPNINVNESTDNAEVDKESENITVDYTPNSDPTVLPDFLQYDTEGLYTFGGVIFADAMGTIIFETADIDGIDVVTAFVDGLCQQGYVLISADDNEEYIWSLKHPDLDIEPINAAESDAQVEVWCYGDMFCVDSSKGIVMEGYEAEYAAAAAEEETRNAVEESVTTSVVFGNGILPSPDAYFGEQLARLYDEDGYKVSSKTGEQRIQGWKIAFKTDLDGLDAFIQYAELLASGNYGLTLDKSWETTFSANKNYYYVYECDGDNDPEVSFDNFTNKNEERRGDFILEIGRHGDNGYAMMTLYFDHDYFSFVEGENVYSGSLTDLSGKTSTDNSNSNNSSNANDRYNTKTPCGYCNDGDCKTCNGRGYLYSSASKKYDRNCTGAYCRNGSCSRCGGDGWMD